MKSQERNRTSANRKNNSISNNQTTTNRIIIIIILIFGSNNLITYSEGLAFNNVNNKISLSGKPTTKWLKHVNNDANVKDVKDIQNEEIISSILTSSVSYARRPFLGAIGLTLGLTTSPTLPTNAATLSGLQWESSPINKRTGVTVFQAEKIGYNVNFVTYLSRFLLSFDADCQRWWYAKAADIPRASSADQVKFKRAKQFASFSASVEVGLQEYIDSNGPSKLMESLVLRYCPDISELPGSLSGPALQFKLREIKEARRQIALLFGLMENNQPVEDITLLLAKIDNATISTVVINDRGMGYAPGYGPPAVTFPDPLNDGREATGRVTLRPNGRILRVDLINRGTGYSDPPKITFTAPKTQNEEDLNSAIAKAVIFKGGKSKHKGSMERIEIQEPGSGYTLSDNILVQISPPSSPNGTQATAKAILEYEVASVDIIDGGYGYAVEKTILVSIEPPPITARLNINDPLVVERLRSEKLLPTNSFYSEIGGGNCMGRACYDTPAKLTAYAKSERDTYYSFRDVKDERKLEEIEEAVEKRSADNGGIYVAAASGNLDYNFSPIWDKSSSSAQLLQLIPEGFGLVYDGNLKRYTLVQAKDYQIISLLQGSSTKIIDPEFGPRGRSPIEREKSLEIDTILRFCASGALCCSGAHLALTPIDVVKTKIQTKPEVYNKGIVTTFKDVWRDEGPSTFFAGWQPTFFGFFVWGGISYSLTEFLRRAFSELVQSSTLGENMFLDSLVSLPVEQLDVTIILAAAGIGAVVGCFFICPFEAVRIRTVAQPDFADSILGVFDRIVKEEGALSLFSAVPAFFLKEVPFACAKFVVFDIATAQLYAMFPAAREDIKLSLLISLTGGSLGGICAAIVSNPADAIISQMKKGKSDIGPIDAAKELWDQGGGVRALFKGLALRSAFYPILVSLQFLVYDSVRIALGVGSDDLKLYLNVLGSALQESGGPV